MHSQKSTSHKIIYTPYLKQTHIFKRSNYEIKIIFHHHFNFYGITWIFSWKCTTDSHPKCTTLKKVKKRAILIHTVPPILLQSVPVILIHTVPPFDLILLRSKSNDFGLLFFS